MKCEDCPNAEWDSVDGHWYIYGCMGGCEEDEAGKIMGDYIENTKINLCDTCKQTYPECPVVGDDITFGDGAGNDDFIKQKLREQAHIIDLQLKERLENERSDNKQDP